LMYTKPDAPDYIDIKGLQVVRRDSPPIVKKVSTEILEGESLSRAVLGSLEVLAGLT